MEQGSRVITSFDHVRETLGESAGPGLVTAVTKLTLDQVDEVADMILSLPRNVTLPERPVTEIWPLVPLRASLFFDHLTNQSPVSGYAPSGVDLSAATNPRFSGTGTFSSGVIRTLLYSHGLVIEDPLCHAAEMYLNQDRELRKITRVGLSTAVASLSEISDLIDSDIVNLFYTGGDELPAAGDLGEKMLNTMDAEGAPYSADDVWDAFETEFVSGLSKPLQACWKEIRGGNSAPDLAYIQQAVDQGNLELAKTFVDVVSILNSRSIVENAIASTACTVSAIRMLGGSCDVLCASPLMARLLFLGTPDPLQQMRVQEITRTTVPNIGILSMSDLVAIRQTSEALATWRNDLADALDYADRLRKSGGDARSIQVGVEEKLAVARSRLRCEARKSQQWSQGNMVSFVTGPLIGAGSGVVDGSTATIISGAAAGLLTAFVQAASQSHRPQSFLDRHYLAFARPESTA